MWRCAVAPCARRCSVGYCACLLSGARGQMRVIEWMLWSAVWSALIIVRTGSVSWLPEYINVSFVPYSRDLVDLSRATCCTRDAFDQAVSNGRLPRIHHCPAEAFPL